MGASKSPSRSSRILSRSPIKSGSRVMDKAQRDKFLGLSRSKSSHFQDAAQLIDPKNEGLVFLGIKRLFEKIQADADSSYCVRLSYVEIYNESVFDLLALQDHLHEPLPIVEDTKAGDFWVGGVTEIIIADAEEAVDLIMSGEENRHFAATRLNHHSSRSHCLIRLFLKKVGENETVFEGICNFVDLAGSEKLGAMLEDKQASLRQREVQSIADRVHESKHINKSLFFLTQIIYMKSRNTKAFIPYRNSCLTKLLKNSIGGNARTTIILCVNPLFRTLAETISTLRFGQRAKKIVNTVSKNAMKEGGVDALKELVADYEKKIQEMEREMKAGKTRKRRGTRKTNLTKLIETLQRQKEMLEEKLKRRHSLLEMFDRSKFTPKKGPRGTELRTRMKSIVSPQSGILFYYETEAIEATGPQNNLANRQFVTEALQGDFVRSVKSRNEELMNKLEESEKSRRELKKRCETRDEENRRLRDLVDMLINKKPEMLVRLDQISRDLLTANGSISIQNVSLVDALSKMQTFASSQGSGFREHTQRDLEEICSKVGFKFSGSYLTRKNLEAQVWGPEDPDPKPARQYDTKRSSLQQRRMDHKIRGMSRHRQDSNLEASTYKVEQEFERPKASSFKDEKPYVADFAFRTMVDTKGQQHSRRFEEDKLNNISGKRQLGVNTMDMIFKERKRGKAFIQNYFDSHDVNSRKTF